MTDTTAVSTLTTEEDNKIDTSEKTVYPDYKYCVWLLPEGKYWYDMNKSIIPHMSIKTNMSLADALNLHKSVREDINHEFLQTRIDDNFMITNDDGFVALQYNIFYSENNRNDPPVWWPKDAHMSMIYKYNKGITDHEKIYMNTYCLKKHALFGTPCLVHCKGHHSEWEIIKL